MPDGFGTVGRKVEPVGRSAADHEVRPFLVALSASTALVHGGACTAHLDEYAGYAVLFAALAAFQAGWAMIVYRGGSVPVLGVGIAVNASVLLVWLLSRTAGLPFGPDAAAPEQFGIADLQASAAEVAIIALAGLELTAQLRAIQLSIPLWARQALLVLLLFSGVALMATAHS